MGYLICALGGFILGATKGDDLENSITRKEGAKRWKDY